MSDDKVPTVTVEADGVSIEVSDARSAQAAMPFIEGALEHYLHAEMREPQRRYEPVEVDCNDCGYEWTYRGKTPNKATCPDCNAYTPVDAETEDRVRD